MPSLGSFPGPVSPDFIIALQFCRMKYCNSDSFLLGIPPSKEKKQNQAKMKKTHTIDTYVHMSQWPLFSTFASSKQATRKASTKRDTKKSQFVIKYVISTVQSFLLSHALKQANPLDLNVSKLLQS